MDPSFRPLVQAQDLWKMQRILLNKMKDLEQSFKEATLQMLEGHLGRSEASMNARMSEN